jgi:type I restriction enzyme M protein
LFIDALQEVTRERSFSYLEDHHIERIATAYHGFENVEGFAQVVSTQAVLNNDAFLKIQ